MTDYMVSFQPCVTFSTKIAFLNGMCDGIAENARPEMQHQNAGVDNNNDHRQFIIVIA